MKETKTTKAKTVKSINKEPIKPIMLPLEDIQGFIVRGYNMAFVRHFVLKVIDAAEAKKFISKIVDNRGLDGLKVTSAAPWKTKREDGKSITIKPEFTLNIGFTYEGLRSLQIKGFTDKSFESFEVYRQGANKRSYYIGDTGESGPENWIKGFEPTNNHVLLSVFSMEKPTLEKTSIKLRDLFSRGLKELNVLDGNSFPDGKIQFGYKDGISQPNVVGFPSRTLDGGQFAVPAWNFVLNDDDFKLDYNGNKILPPPSQPASPLDTKGAAPYKLPVPRELGLYGSFAAFRVLEQDVVGFEEFLQSQKDKIDPELLAGKLCGRWRSGTPLALAPHQDIEIDEMHLNNYNYIKPKAGAPNASDDPNTVNDLLGIRCPIGSHMRRNNPRNSPVSSDVTIHRIIRRGMPYGPPYDPKQKYDGVKRGLLGLFICASLESQFEFLMHNWVNDGEFAPDILNTKDPILGANDEGTSLFNLAAGPDQTMQISGFKRFIKTKGSSYVFFPGINGLKFISQ